MQILFPDQSCDGWDDKAHQSSAADGSPVSSSVSSEQDSDLVSGERTVLGSAGLAGGGCCSSLLKCLAGWCLHEV